MIHAVSPLMVSHATCDVVAGLVGVVDGTRRRLRPLERQLRGALRVHFLVPTGGQHQYFYVLSQSGGVVLKSTSDWPMDPAGEGEASWASCRAFESWEQPLARQGRCSRLDRSRVISGEDEFFDENGRTLRRPGVAVSFPYAALAVPCLLPAALGVRRLLRRGYRRRRLLCIRCGYDLRATRTRCPECGLTP